MPDLPIGPLPLAALQTIEAMKFGWELVHSVRGTDTSTWLQRGDATQEVPDLTFQALKSRRLIRPKRGAPQFPTVTYVLTLKGASL